MPRVSTSLSAAVFASLVFAMLSMAIAATEANHDSSNVVVRTRQGKIEGMAIGKVEQFRGLPYATPPLGDLRWKAPLPPKPYSGTMHATSWPPPCVQARALPEFPTPSEDCLYLNLYRPSGSKEGRKMPVLVYFHGGGFAGGTASARDGMELAAGNDMIVIMTNYRLGALGWLGLAGLDAETSNGTSSGNYGLLDMAASLRWIQDNISAFGGDPYNVTIAGTSAGGIAVCALITAHLHESLFRRAIIESGECANSSTFIVSHEAALLQGAKFAAKAGCVDAKAFVSCLRSKPAEKLLSASEGLGTFGANVGGSLLPKAPMEAIKSGAVDRVPVMVGANHDEQKHNPAETTGFPGTMQGYQRYLQNSFGALAPLVAAEYPAGAYSDPAYAAGAAATDSGTPNGIGFCPMLAELGEALAKVTQTFAYELDDPQGSGRPDAKGFEFGSMHTAEINFLYSETAAATRTTKQMELATRMQHYWASFARNGRPEDGGHPWLALEPESGNVLRFQPDGDAVVPLLTVSNDHHCTFWAGLGY